MPRRSSGMSSRSSSRSGPTRSSATTAAPPRASAPPQQAQGGSMLGGFAGTMMQGMAFGAGSEVAHQAVRGMMGGSSHQEAPQQAQQAQQTQQAAQSGYEACSRENQSFMSCLQQFPGDIGSCQSYLDMFKQCKGQFN